MPRPPKMSDKELVINSKYSIMADELNIILCEKKVKTDTLKTKAENIGKEYTEFIGYFSTVKSALHFLVEHDIKAQGFEDFKKLNDRIDKLQKDIERLPLTNAIVRS